MKTVWYRQPNKDVCQVSVIFLSTSLAFSAEPQIIRDYLVSPSFKIIKAKFNGFSAAFPVHWIFRPHTTNSAIIQQSWLVQWCEHLQLVNMGIFPVITFHPTWWDGTQAYASFPLHVSAQLDLTHIWYMMLYSVSFSTAISTPSVEAGFSVSRHSDTVWSCCDIIFNVTLTVHFHREPEEHLFFDNCTFSQFTAKFWEQPFFKIWV